MQTGRGAALRAIAFGTKLTWLLHSTHFYFSLLQEKNQKFFFSISPLADHLSSWRWSQQLKDRLHAHLNAAYEQMRAERCYQKCQALCNTPMIECVQMRVAFFPAKSTWVKKCRKLNGKIQKSRRCRWLPPHYSEPRLIRFFFNSLSAMCVEVQDFHCRSSSCRLAAFL